MGRQAQAHRIPALQVQKLVDSMEGGLLSPKLLHADLVDLLADRLMVMKLQRRKIGVLMLTFPKRDKSFMSQQ